MLSLRAITILLEEKRNQETEGMKDIITLPEYKIEIPNEKLIECMHMISLHKDNKITKRELKDLALNKNLIQVGKRIHRIRKNVETRLYTWH